MATVDPLAATGGGAEVAGGGALVADAAISAGAVERLGDSSLATTVTAVDPDELAVLSVAAFFEDWQPVAASTATTVHDVTAMRHTWVITRRIFRPPFETCHE